MKKIFNLILASSVALGFAACNNDRAQNEPNGSSDVTAMRLVVGEASTRAGEDDQANAAGAIGESEVTKGYFMTRGNDGEVVNVTKVSPFAPVGDEQEAQWASEAFLYGGTTGSVESALVLNNNDSYTGFDTKAILKIDALKNVAKKGAFTMSSATKSIVITAGVTEAEANAESNAKNNFDFTVERLASKVQVSQPSAGVKVGGTELKDKAEFSELRYAVAGGAKTIYLFADQAGERTLKNNPTKGAVYTGYESAIHNLPATTYKVEDGLNKVNKRRDVTKVSDKLLVTLDPAATDFTEKQSLQIEKAANDESYKTTSADKGIYFYENSVKSDNLHYNDITHVKFYGKMGLKETASELIIKTVDEKGQPDTYATKEDLETAQTSVVYVTEEQKNKFTSKEGVVIAEESDKTDKEGNKLYKMTITEKAGTFYVGADNKMYLTLDASRDAGNKTSKKYTEGKMVWKTPANRQAVGDEVKYADTRRNNIYSLSLTEISGIGDNYDPIDPTDPNIEKPEDNPDEPEVDEEDPVNEVKTYIKVKATILKWNLVHRGVVLK